MAYFSKKLNNSQKKRKAIYIETLAIREAVRYWQYWLLGRRFVVFSDHKPLEGLSLKSRPDEELGDMINYLLQFDFVVKYKPGITNLEADCLSRSPVLQPTECMLEDCVRAVNFIGLSDILTDQKQLPFCTAHVMKNDIIYRKRKNKYKIVLTEKFGKELVHRTHEKYGHVGSKHLFNILCPYYYFRHMRSFINSVSSVCEVCICNKTRTKSSFGFLGHLGPAEAPFHIMSLDTIGGFGGRRSTKRYLHLLVDHFTRYAYISTSKNQTADQFICLLTSVQKENNIRILLTDQYGSLTSNEFESYLESVCIQHIFTAVNSPFSNGLNDRLNQTIVNRIRCRMNENKNNKKKAWSTVARQCITEYNDTVHSVTGFSPSYLMHGKQVAVVPPELVETRDFVKDLNSAFQNSQRYHYQNKLRYDRHHSNILLQVGDYVYIENGNKLNREKLDAVRIGPFQIVKKISNTIYLIRIHNDNRLGNSRLYHVSKLVPASTLNSDI